MVMNHLLKPDSKKQLLEGKKRVAIEYYKETSI